MNAPFNPQRLSQCLARLKSQNRAAFVAFLTAGDPDHATSATMLNALPASGADIIEIGMPFSDPMADGPTIQRAAQRALKAGATLIKTLALAENVRNKHPDTPIILMGYYNPIYRFGNQRFLDEVRRVGVDGLIIVDLPPEEDQELAEMALDQGIAFIRLVTPTSTDTRLDTILHRASGFIYYVSITGITGTRAIDTTAIAEHINVIKSRTSLPIVVGFGVKTPDHAEQVAQIADGVVVGSALIDSIEQELNNPERGVTRMLTLAEALASATHKVTKSDQTTGTNHELD